MLIKLEFECNTLPLSNPALGISTGANFKKDVGCPRWWKLQIEIFWIMVNLVIEGNAPKDPENDE